MSEKLKAMIAIGLIIFVLAGASLYSGITHNNHSIDNLIAITEQDTNHLLQTINDFTLQLYRLKIIHLLESSPQIVEAFAKRDRKLLYDLTLPKYEDYCCENSYLDIMHFHLPDGTSFLRVHNPEFFGDDLKSIRPMINAVNQNHEPNASFEIGRHGPSYRIAQPVFYNNDYVGVLEFGVNVYQVIDALESQTSIKATPFFDQKSWSKATEYREETIKSGEFIITAHNRPLSKRLPEGFDFTKDEHPIISHGNLTYIVHSHPLFNDFHGENIAGILLFQEVSPIVESSKSSILILTLLTAGLLIMAFIALYYTFGRIIKSLQEREAKLASILRAAPTGIGVVVDRVITEVNERLCQMLGYNEAELLEKSSRMLYTSDSEYERVGREKYLQISEQGSGTVETRMRRKDGNLIDVLLSSTPLEIDDLSAGVTFTATDISSIKDTEKKLLQSENRFRSMMESMSDPAYICSADFRVEYMNPAMVKRCGRDAIGESCFKALHDFDEKCPWCAGKEKTHKKYFESEVVSPKDNRSYHVSHSPIVNEDGSTSTLTIFRDTTEFKEMEAQFHQAQKMEAIGTLAGGVAHDFNNILSVIRGHAQLGMMQTTAENPLWSDLVEIEKSGERASRLTRQLLAFSRKQAINPEMIMINFMINDLSKMLKRLIGEDIVLETNLDEKISPILADSGQLEQVIINLVVNASDAVKELPLSSERKITISTSDTIIDSDFVASHAESKTGRHLLLEVSDSGKGISKEVLEHIFEPFFTTKESGKGTGLGLATIYGIVKQNQAAISVESEPDKGATFKIYWPSLKESRNENLESEKLEAVHGGDEVILVVEDEESTRNLAGKVLQQAGYSVIEAENGIAALKKAKAFQGNIDLLFTDIVMPKMGGKELSEKLSTLYPEIELLFTSGYLGDRIKQDDIIFKDNRFINKPYDVTVLLRKVRQLLDRGKKA